ncbi:hypothetical protein PHJA_001582400, partial [Phtheirospermum japonicum]
NHHHHLSSSAANLLSDPFDKIAKVSDPGFLEKLVLVGLDPTTAILEIGLLGPFLFAFGFLFILIIVMCWYPKLPVEKFLYVIAYASTEPSHCLFRQGSSYHHCVELTSLLLSGLVCLVSLMKSWLAHKVSLFSYLSRFRICNVLNEFRCSLKK